MKNINAALLLSVKLSFYYLLVMGRGVFALNTVDTGFQLAPNELKTIVAHDTCKKVWNATTNTHFVSTKTSMEWTNFYVNYPTGITVRSCDVSCSTLNKTGGYSSGVYAIDLDGTGPLTAMNVYCDLTTDGGGWTKVFAHNVSGGYFPSTNSAVLYNQTDPTQNLYSILQYLDNFENLNRITFKLYYPDLNKKNIWSQLNNPIYDTPVKGYRSIDVEMKEQKWGGLEKGNNSFSPNNGDSSFLDGSVEHSNWYYAIGSKAAYLGIGVPGPFNDNVPVTKLELYAHDEGRRPMSCQHILELGESKGSGVYTIYPDQLNPITTYCEMSIDSGGWTLFYANAAEPTISNKRSYVEHLSDLAGIPINTTNYADANTVGMFDFTLFKPTQFMLRDIANWGVNDFATVEFFNPIDFENILSLKHAPNISSGVCRDMQNGFQFKYRNSNGANYYFDKAFNYAGFGWGDCIAGWTQTPASDVDDDPRHFIYSAYSNADASRVRGVGGFNNGDLTVKARFFLREKYDRPKNCMDILENGKSVGSGSYTIYPEGVAVVVDCDMTTKGGGWTKVWHGFPSHAAVGNLSLQVYSKSNSISFNQMRMEGVNTGMNIIDNTWKTAYLDKTIPEYFQQILAQPDASQPYVKFADFSGTENVPLVGKYFFQGYGNSWRVFHTCVNVDPLTTDRIFVGGSYSPYCDVQDTFNQETISTCTSTGNYYCTDAINSTEVDTGLGLTLKQYQETRVWVRSIPSMKSCREYLDKGFSNGDGVYLIDPDGPSGTTEPFPTFCDMTTKGGGWTLVWGNTLGGTNKPVTGITYSDAVNTRPRCSLAGASTNDLSGNCSFLYNTALASTDSVTWLEKFNYFTGLKHWDDLSQGRDLQMLYRWSSNYGAGINKEAILNIGNFDPAQNYKLVVKSHINTVGSVSPGVVSHSDRMFSTIDADNDVHASNCADLYSDSPFWYGACWSGSFSGGGETAQDGYLNGAYWNSSAKIAGDPVTGEGGGNGWIFIREMKSAGRLKSSCKEIIQENPSAPSGMYTIDPYVGTPNDQVEVYCDMTTSGGGWTLVAYSNGTATASLPNDFMVGSYNSHLTYSHDKANYYASMNPEAFSKALGTTDAMFVSPSYNGGVAYIDIGFGLWDYNTPKCTGPIYHSGRTAGCTGQNANDNFDTVDAFNIAINSGNEAIVPAYKATEVCYNGKGSCSFKFFLR